MRDDADDSSPERGVGRRTHQLTSEDWRPAGAGVRVLATLLDMVFFTLLSAVLAYPLVTHLPTASEPSVIAMVAAAAADRQWVHMTLLVLVGWILLWWVYFIVGWGYLGASPGQRLLGLRLVDHRGHWPIGPARSGLRLIAYCVSSVLLCLGHLLPLVRRDRRAFHDILAGTRVVRRRRRPKSDPRKEEA